MKKIAFLVVVLVLIVAVVFVFLTSLVERERATIYIRADGSVEGTTHIVTVDNVTYTFTGNNYDTIVVERDNIVINGAGYTLRGTGVGRAIYIRERSNVAIRNIRIRGFFHGISLGLSSNISISGNDIKGAYYGVLLQTSPNNTISGNNMKDNDYGIAFFRSPNNLVCHNNFIDNAQQVRFMLYENDYSNFWDDGDEGNYWSDYLGIDSDGNGIGDTPYVINSINQDNHPLTSPWGLVEEEIPFWMQWWLWTIVVAVIAVSAGTVYFLKRKKPPTERFEERRIIR